MRLNKDLEIASYQRPTRLFLTSVTFSLAYSARDKGSLSTDYTDLCGIAMAKLVEQVVQVGQKMIVAPGQGRLSPRW